MLTELHHADDLLGFDQKLCIIRSTMDSTGKEFLWHQPESVPLSKRHTAHSS